MALNEKILKCDRIYREVSAKQQELIWHGREVIKRSGDRNINSLSGEHKNTNLMDLNDSDVEEDEHYGFAGKESNDFVINSELSDTRKIDVSVLVDQRNQLRQNCKYVNYNPVLLGL
mgnify:FL=1